MTIRDPQFLANVEIVDCEGLLRTKLYDESHDFQYFSILNDSRTHYILSNRMLSVFSLKRMMRRGEIDPAVIPK